MPVAHGWHQEAPYWRGKINIHLFTPILALLGGHFRIPTFSSMRPQTTPTNAYVRRTFWSRRVAATGRLHHSENAVVCGSSAAREPVAGSAITAAKRGRWPKPSRHPRIPDAGALASLRLRSDPSLPGLTLWQVEHPKSSNFWARRRCVADL